MYGFPLLSDLACHVWDEQDLMDRELAEMASEGGEGKQGGAADLRPLSMRDIISARSMVHPTAEKAEDYLYKATGMTKDDFERMMNGQ